MFRGDDHDPEEDGHYEGPELYPTLDEIRAAAQIVVFLEHDIGIDVRRVRVRVREGTVFIQGTVDTQEQRTEIEEELPRRPGVRSIDCRLSVQKIL